MEFQYSDNCFYKFNIKQEFDLEVKPIKIEAHDESLEDLLNNTSIKQEELDLGEDVIFLNDDYDNNNFLCELCGFTTSSQGIFLNHQQYHTKSDLKKFTCIKCSYQTIYRGDLNTHMSVEHGKGKKCIPQCKSGKKEAKSTKLNCKLVVHNNLEKLQCAKCSFCTENSNILIKHMTEHSEPSCWWKCKQCQFHTEKLAEMSRHHKHAHGVKNECNRRHLHKTLLEISRLEMFKCGACDFKTKFKRCLLDHMTKKHPLNVEKKEECSTETFNDCCVSGVVWYKCGLCQFKTNSEAEVCLHLNKFHAPLLIIHK